MDTIQKTVASLPHAPGVYQFYDCDGTILYVGKARDLFKRVSSYFASPSQLSEKTRQLVSHIRSIRIHTVATEFEALLLEAKYIRAYEPKYNMIAKDDKSPIYIRIPKNEVLPRVSLSRKPKNTDASDKYYFGPYASKKTALFIIRTLRHSIPFCQQKVRNGKPCFYTHLGLCSPCPSVIQKMPEEKQKKELTHLYRQHIQRLRWILSGQSKKTILSLQKDMQKEASRNNFEKAALLRNQIQALISTLNTSYDPFLFEEIDKLEKAPDEQVAQLRRILEPHFPSISSLHRIECYDMSTLQGSASVGSMVVLIDGIPYTNEYRKFQIRSTSALSDTKMMEEVVKRRLLHEEWPLPDLIVVDGGKAQVAEISALLVSLRKNIPVIGLAKRFEQILMKVNTTFTTITIPLSSPALQLLQHIRDEAHRFAVSYHRQLRKRAFAP